MKYLRHVIKVCIIYLKLKFNWASSILPGKPNLLQAAWEENVAKKNLE